MMNDDTGGHRVWPLAAGAGRRLVRPRVFRGPAGAPALLAAVAAVAALALAGCGAGGSTSQQVASLPTSSSPATGGAGNSGTATDGSSPDAQSTGGVTALLNQWAACERSNGDPNQSDPTVDAGAVIEITIPKGAQLAGNVHERTGTCGQYLAGASNDLRAANPVPPAPDDSDVLKYVSCIRANGVPDFPYPAGDSINFQGSGVDPYDASVQQASQMCGNKLGLPAWWVNGTDTPGSVEAHVAGSNPNAEPPPCFYQKVDPCSGYHSVTGGSNG